MMSITSRFRKAGCMANILDMMMASRRHAKLHDLCPYAGVPDEEITLSLTNL